MQFNLVEKNGINCSSLESKRTTNDPNYQTSQANLSTGHNSDRLIKLGRQVASSAFLFYLREKRPKNIYENSVYLKG